MCNSSATPATRRRRGSCRSEFRCSRPLSSATRANPGSGMSAHDHRLPDHQDRFWLRRRPGAAAAQTDRIDHHVLAAPAVDHFSLAHGTLTQNSQARCTLPSLQTARSRAASHPGRRTRPWRCRALAIAVWAHPGRSRSAAPPCSSLGSRVNAGLIVISCRTTPTRVSSSGRSREKLCAKRLEATAGCPPTLPETSSMTISRIGCGELSNWVIGCGLPSSRHFRIVRGERRHKPAVTIRNGDEDPDDVASPSEHRLLTPSRADYAKKTRNECRTRDEPNHAHVSSSDRTASHLSHITGGDPQRSAGGLEGLEGWKGRRVGRPGLRRFRMPGDSSSLKNGQGGTADRFDSSIRRLASEPRPRYSIGRAWVLQSESWQVGGCGSIHTKAPKSAALMASARAHAPRSTAAGLPLACRRNRPASATYHYANVKPARFNVVASSILKKASERRYCAIASLYSPSTPTVAGTSQQLANAT